MAEFRMPSLGADMEAGRLVEWLRRPGDAVKRGDIIAVVETQKGAIEIEVFEAGEIETLLVPVGTTVPVGTPLALIRAPGAPEAAAPPPAPPRPAAAPAAPARAPAAAAPPPAPAAPDAAPEAMKASPAARRLAAEKGIDLATLRGSGPEGAIVFVDVEQAWQHAQPAGAPAAPATPPAPAAPKPIDLAAMRGAIAAAMARAKREIPHYYVQHAADLGAATDWLAATNAARPPDGRLVLGALLVKAVALAVRAMPEFNGHFRDGRFEPAGRVHVGSAIALRGGGLVAPAIHDADTLPLDAVMARLRDLVNRVRAGRYRASELADPTVTLTSLGDRGADAMLPIINPPQVAIIAAGTPARRPWVVGDGLAVRPVMLLSLAADHRASDGHRGALLLADIARRLTEPASL
ncbi:MAG: 2-oxo acid dehydrogenase subunit E2 [Alphaproteobacteria bacterium]|nr:2-oxo acid dehydrogenase subunit E2 [Alphaproteobacteria bacterium]